jgi:hypothetical protein
LVRGLEGRHSVDGEKFRAYRHLRSGARAVVGNGANRRFKFDKRRQLFICAHNEMLSVAAIMVSTVGSIGGYKQPFPNPKTRSVFSSARTIKRFPSSRCASAIQIVRPVELIVETQPQLQPQ